MLYLEALAKKNHALMRSLHTNKIFRRVKLYYSSALQFFKTVVQCKRSNYLDIRETRMCLSGRYPTSRGQRDTLRQLKKRLGEKGFYPIPLRQGLQISAFDVMLVEKPRAHDTSTPRMLCARITQEMIPCGADGKEATIAKPVIIVQPDCDPALYGDVQELLRGWSLPVPVKWYTQLPRPPEVSPADYYFTTYSKRMLGSFMLT